MTEITKREELTEGEQNLISKWEMENDANSISFHFEVKNEKFTLVQEKQNDKLLDAEYSLITGVVNSQLGRSLVENAAVSLVRYINKGNFQEVIARKTVEAYRVIINSLLEMKPKDIFETMLCLRMISLHFLGMDQLGKNNLSLSMDHNNQLIARMTKAFRLWNEAFDRLEKHRRKEDQKMVIEHVHINTGGQAVIGNVTSKGRGA